MTARITYVHNVAGSACLDFNRGLTQLDACVNDMTKLMTAAQTEAMYLKKHIICKSQVLDPNLDFSKGS